MSENPPSGQSGSSELPLRKLPGAVFAYRLLCCWFAVCQLALVYLGIWLQSYVPPPETPASSVKLLPILGLFLIPMAIVFFAANAYMALAKPKPWMWVAGVTNIIGGVIFCPVSFVLLVPWYRPEVKAFFDPEKEWIR